MKTRTAQLMAITATALVAAAIVSPWVLAVTSTNGSTTISNSLSSSTFNPAGQNYAICQCRPGPGFGHENRAWAGPSSGPLATQNTVDLTVGQTITVTSSQGAYFVMGTPSINGTASGTITFTITSELTQGYTLSITSGNIVVGGTTYAISSGTAQAGPFADSIIGQGTTTPTGTFLLRGLARGSFAGTTGQLFFDLKTGSTEYAVALTGAIQS